MTDNKGILSVCEITDGALSAISHESLGICRKLADKQGEKLTALLLGNASDTAATQAIASGADTVYVTNSPLLNQKESDLIFNIIKTAAQQLKPAVIVVGQTDMGREQAPRLAFSFGTNATLDCTELDIENGRLRASKPVYGGNAMAVYVCENDPQIVTIRSKSMTALEPDSTRQGEIVELKIDLEAITSRTKIKQSIVEETAGIKLEDATTIVAGGRGIGTQEGFSLLEELARVLKGAVGASRPPCDNGWIPDTYQIGLTGKIVAPELYITVAISGSSQHMSGCAGARTIVAINKDKEANIFRYARFGAVGDWKKILPAFTAKVKELIVE